MQFHFQKYSSQKNKFDINKTKNMFSIFHPKKG